MAKIIAPNKSYTGITAGVAFVKGEGSTENPWIIKWFKKHGYEVIENANIDDNKQEETIIDNMDVEELKTYAEVREIDIGQATTREGILKKIRAASGG